MVVFDDVHFTRNDKGFFVFFLTLSHSIAVLGIRLLFDSLIQCSSTPENRSVMIRHLFDIAPSEVLAYFDVSPDGDFSIDSMMIEGTKRTG